MTAVINMSYWKLECKTFCFQFLGDAKLSGQMNMRGVYLHILGDALGSVIVIIAALLVHFFEGEEWTLYIDPVLR